MTYHENDKVCIIWIKKTYMTLIDDLFLYYITMVLFYVEWHIHLKFLRAKIWGKGKSKEINYTKGY